MTSPFWTTVYYRGHFVNENGRWEWKFSDGVKATGLPITTETSYEELYAKVQSICKVDPYVHNMEIGFINPAMIQSLQFPVQITSDDEVQWYLNLNKQGSILPLCVTFVSKDNCDMQREENNGSGCDMQQEQNGVGYDMQPDENNGVGGCDMQLEQNGVGYDMQSDKNNGVGGCDMQREQNGVGYDMQPDENNGVSGCDIQLEQNGVGYDMQPEENNGVGGCDMQQEGGNHNCDVQEENKFTSEDLVSLVGSTSRVVPPDFDLKAEQVFINKKGLQEAVYMIALKYNFQFKTKKSNKNVYTIVCVDDNCKWRLRATKVSECDNFQIRKYTAEHTCALNLSTNDHRQARSWIIGKHIMPRFEDRNTTRPADIMNEIRRDFGVEISYQKARRALKRFVGSGGPL